MNFIILLEIYSIAVSPLQSRRELLTIIAGIFIYFFSFACFKTSILEVKPISGELRFGVPGEPIIFNLKKEDCKFPEDFIAIYFEQVLHFNNISLFFYLKRPFQSITNSKRKSRTSLKDPYFTSISWKIPPLFSLISIKMAF